MERAVSVKQYSNGEIIDGNQFVAADAVSIRVGSMIMPIGWAYIVDELEFVRVNTDISKSWAKDSVKIIKTPALYLGLRTSLGRKWVRILVDERVFICYSGEFTALEVV